MSRTAAGRPVAGSVFDALSSEVPLSLETVSALDGLEGDTGATELEPDPEPVPDGLEPVPDDRGGLLWGWLGGGVLVTGSVYCSSPAPWASAVEGTSRSASRTRRATGRERMGSISNRPGGLLQAARKVPPRRPVCWRLHGGGSQL